MRKRLVLLLVGVLLCFAQGGRADELFGAVHFSGGTNKNPATAPAFSAGFHFDPATFAPVRIQVFELGVSYDRLQSRNGASVEFRARMPVFRCYGGSLTAMGNGSGYRHYLRLETGGALVDLEAMQVLKSKPYSILGLRMRAVDLRLASYIASPSIHH